MSAPGKTKLVLQPRVASTKNKFWFYQIP